MNAPELGVLIPIIAVGGFFGWMITLSLSKMYLARLKAQGDVRPMAGQEDVLAALEALRHEVTELAERVDFTERLLARGREVEAGKLAPGDRRTGSA
ncbi:MAG: hypothetical protein DMD46_15795 [Gemmatimonadetes bacterium]|nr:MAG: hypothetical protein DMD46_15795 [Gemmatimonadota bacterium]